MHERIHFDGDLIITEETHDISAEMHRIRQLKDAHGGVVGESWHVGSIPFPVLETWLREAGVSFTDQKAVEDVIKRNLQNGEFEKLRIKDGTW